MIGIDTNILVRFLVQDDPEQCEIVDRLVARALEKEEKVFINIIVLCETMWVLASVYGVNKSNLIETLNQIVKDPIVSLQHREEIGQAISAFSKGHGDFADYLIGVLNECFACSATYTFDRKMNTDKLFSSP